MNRRRIAALLAAAPAILATAAPAAAAPGNPGVPGPPLVVFEEDFENVPNPALAQRLAVYQGEPPTSMTYNAHPAWLNGAACNGVIGSFNSTTGTSGCSASVYNTYIRAIARGMGAALGGGNDNQVLGDVTVSGFPAPSTPAATLETRASIPLTSTSRFITFSIDAGAMSCGAAHPLLRFFLLDGSTPVEVTDTAIDPCTDPRGAVSVGVRVGSYATDESILLSGGSLGVRLTNDQTSGSGNDYAVDNLRILDATPQLDKEFTDAETFSGEPATLTFTITNTSDLAAKRGWSFTDALPAGLEIASPSAVSTDCPSATVDASPGDTSIAVEGDLETNQASCEVTVDVVSPVPGTFENCPANITAIVGLDSPACSSLTVLPPRADVEVEKSAAPANPTPGSTVEYTLTVTNNGPATARDVVVADLLPPGVSFASVDPGAPDCTFASGTVACELGSLAAGETRAITITGTVDAAPPAPPPEHEHQLSVEKVEAQVDLEPSETRTVLLSCPGGGQVMADGSVRADSVDQGAGTLAAVETVRAESTSPGAYEFVVTNNASGRAQAKVFGLCVPGATGSEAGHTHALLVSDPPVAVTSLPLATGRHDLTLSCGSGYTAIAPGIDVGAGSARLVASEPFADGGRRFTVDVSEPGTEVTVTARCLANGVGTTDGHSHPLLLEEVARQVSVPANSTVNEVVSCPGDAKGIVASYDLPAGLVLLGHDPQPTSRVFKIANTTAAPIDATIDLLCLGDRTGGAVLPTQIVNSGIVSTSTMDPDTTNNVDSASLIVGGPGPGPGPVPAPIVPPAAPDAGEPRLGGGTATLHGSSVAIPVICEGSGCDGSLVLRAVKSTGPIDAGEWLGAGAFALDPGATTVEVSVRPVATRLAARGKLGRLKVVMRYHEGGALNRVERVLKLKR